MSKSKSKSSGWFISSIVCPICLKLVEVVNGETLKDHGPCTPNASGRLVLLKTRAEVGDDEITFNVDKYLP